MATALKPPTTRQNFAVAVLIVIREIVFINHLLEFLFEAFAQTVLLRTPGRILSQMPRNHKDGKVKIA
jgi:hypothetical protein